MKLYCSAVLFLLAALPVYSLVKNKKAVSQRQRTPSTIRKPNVRALGPKTKQNPAVASKTNRNKPKVSTQNLKRWIPKGTAKKPVKYIVKIVNNKKRWMPAFADFSNDMESSMMYDSGFVAGGEQQQTFSSSPQQQSSMFRPQAQETPPEQSFLTPDMSYQPPAAVGRAVNGQYQQGYANDIEAFTKDVSLGLPGTTETTDLSSLENYPDSAFMNSKFQEGDYIGNSLHESKQPNLFDSFTFNPTLTQGPKEPGSLIMKAQANSTPNSGAQAAKSDSSTQSQAKPPTKEANTVENEGKAEDKKVNKEDGKSSEEKNVKEANSKPKKADQRSEAKETEAKEKNEVSDADKDENKQKDAAQVVKTEAKPQKSVKNSQKSREKNTEDNSAKVEEKQANAEKTEETSDAKTNEKVVADTKVTEQQQSEESSSVDNSKQKEDNAKQVQTEESTSTDQQDKSSSNEQAKVQEANNNVNVESSKLTQADKQAPLKESSQENVQNDTSEENQAIINKQINKMRLQKEQESKDNQNAVRIKKLKQRIRNQKQRHQASAATRYQITSDGNSPISDLSMAANVSPAKATLGFAAGQLRKQLVTNLRHALMKNVVAAMAHRKNTAAVAAARVKQSPRTAKTGSLQEETSELNNAVINMKPQASNAGSQSESGNNQGGSINNMAPQNTDNEPSQDTSGKSSSNQGLVTTLMKMDKQMLVETIVKLLKKHKDDRKAQGNTAGEDENQKQMAKDSDHDGNINLSFHGKEETTSGNDRQQEAPTQNMAIQGSEETQESQPSTPQQGDSQETSTQTGETIKQESPAINKQTEAEPTAQDENGHSEFKAYPVKSKDGTKLYKFQRLNLNGQEANQIKPDDPYAQIGLVDPGNNDKVGKHHSESSDLKQDLEKQTNLVSKFISTGTKQEPNIADSTNPTSSDDQKSTDSLQQVVQAANPDQQSDNQGSANREATNQGSTNQESNGQVSPNQGSVNQESANQDSTNQASTSQGSANQESTNQGSSDQQDTAVQSAANQNTETTSNNAQDQSSDGNPKPDQQASSNNEADSQSTQTKEETTQQSDEKATQQRQIQQEKVEQLPDGTKVESQVSADNPRVLAQLNRISDRLHQKMAEQSNSKAGQRLGNGQVKNFTNDLSDMPTDDAYASIGSFDPNVKKKAAIVKKKTRNSIK